MTYQPLSAHSALVYPVYVNDQAEGTAALQELGFDTSFTQPGWYVVWDPRMGAIAVMNADDFAANWTLVDTPPNTLTATPVA